jgi:apolipoprotein N-acyltransferase
VSAVIAPDGRMVQHTGIFQRDVLVQRVPLRSGSTVATRLGVLPELLLAAVAALAVLTGLVRPRARVAG